MNIRNRCGAKVLVEKKSKMVREGGRSFMLLLAFVSVVGLLSIPARAADENKCRGALFVSGHDADYHAHSCCNNLPGAQGLLQRAVAYVSFNKLNPKILLVTDLRNPGGDQSDPRLGLTDAGFIFFDVAVAPTSPRFDSLTLLALNLNRVRFRDYDVVIVASDYGGWLRQGELDILNARRDDLIEFVNKGGGLVVFAESGGRPQNGDPTIYTGVTHNRYDFLPFLDDIPRLTYPLNTEGSPSNPFIRITPEGVAAGLTINDVTGNFLHSVFTNTGGLDILDVQLPIAGDSTNGRLVTLGMRGKILTSKGVIPCREQNDEREEDRDK